jgi:hypothetical protein
MLDLLQFPRKANENIHSCRAFSTDFVIFSPSNLSALLPVGRVLGGMVGLQVVRLLLGGYSVFGVQPSPQINQLASLGAKREVLCLFLLLLRGNPDDFVADGALVLHNQVCACLRL